MFDFFNGRKRSSNRNFRTLTVNSGHIVEAHLSNWLSFIQSVLPNHMRSMSVQCILKKSLFGVDLGLAASSVHISLRTTLAFLYAL